MLNIAICDDDESFRSNLRYIIEREYPTRFQVIEYSNGKSLVHEIENGIAAFDIILLDVKMPWLDGIQSATRLRDLGAESVIVLITNYEDFVYDGYDVRAFHYLLKPIRRGAFLPVFEQAVKEAESRAATKTIALETRRGVRYLPIKDILFMESRLRKISVVTHSGAIYEVYGKLSDLEARLKPLGFIRPHRSYLINLHHLTYLDKVEPAIYLGAVRVPVARAKVGIILSMMFEHGKGASGHISG